MYSNEKEGKYPERKIGALKYYLILLNMVKTEIEGGRATTLETMVPEVTVENAGSQV
jgi:hypothetical protein